MDVCAKCGTCAEVCPVITASRRRSTIPPIALISSEASSSGTTRCQASCSVDWPEPRISTRPSLRSGETSSTRAPRAGAAPSFVHSHRQLGDYAQSRTLLDGLGRTPASLQRVIKASLETRNTDGASAVPSGLPLPSSRRKCARNTASTSRFRSTWWAPTISTFLRQRRPGEHRGHHGRGQGLPRAGMATSGP